MPRCLHANWAEWFEATEALDTFNPVANINLIKTWPSRNFAGPSSNILDTKVSFSGGELSGDRGVWPKKFVEAQRLSHGHDHNIFGFHGIYLDVRMKERWVILVALYTLCWKIKPTLLRQIQVEQLLTPLVHDIWVRKCHHTQFFAWLVNNIEDAIIARVLSLGEVKIRSIYY